MWCLRKENLFFYQKKNTQFLPRFTPKNLAKKTLNLNVGFFYKIWFNFWYDSGGFFVRSGGFFL